MTTTTYRAEFFTAADYAFRNFEAETPEQALELPAGSTKTTSSSSIFAATTTMPVSIKSRSGTASAARSRRKTTDYRLRQAARSAQGIRILFQYYA